jgi:hypothetical protein
MLVLMRGVYEVHPEMASGGMIYMIFYDEWFRHSSNIKVITSII